jgi:SPP1 gp7 family putative phage head morphogenesis protein
MPPKPPKNKVIDARVLARRQKDLDGFIDRYQGILDKRAVTYASEINPLWERIGRTITEEIRAIYHELQDANGVPITKQPIDKAKYRNMQRQILRLARLQQQIIEIIGTEAQIKKLERNIVYSYAHSYYFHAFGMEQAAKVNILVPVLTVGQVYGVIQNPWLPDGNTYSDRLRANTTYLAQKMEQAVEEAVGSGWPINRTARRIQEIAGEGFYNSVRLARTEISRAASIGSTHTYMQNADILDGKRWNATLDSETAPKDAANDGKIYDMDYDTPENPAPAGQRIPNHPNCRCKYSPVLSALGVSTKERIARNENGERIYTKARTYREYAKERGLPDLDERLRNDDPRRYLRRGEDMEAYDT